MSDLVEQIRLRYVEIGQPVHEIASELGVSRDLIYRTLRRLAVVRTAADTKRNDMSAPAFKYRFWSMVDKSGECWIWTGHRFKSGHGCVGVNYKNKKAHRIAWELTNGKIPKGKMILHSCDNPPCCRPDHLRPGTNLENIADRCQRDRTARGRGSWNAKITEDDVKLIRFFFHKTAANRGNGRILAKIFGVRDGQIYSVANRLSWKHV